MSPSSDDTTNSTPKKAYLYHTEVLLCISCGVTGHFTCSPETTMFGVADVPLSDGTMHALGFTKPDCQRQCESNHACQSFIFIVNDGTYKGYCELWSKSTGTSTRTATEHCVIPQGTCTVQDQPWCVLPSTSCIFVLLDTHSCLRFRKYFSLLKTSIVCKPIYWSKKVLTIASTRMYSCFFPIVPEGIDV